jgi:hypothetical protein
MVWWDNDTNLVQAAQVAYCETMDGHWRRVVAGEITEADYWRIGEGEPRAICRAAIDEAMAAYDAGHPPRRRKPSRRERAWQRVAEQHRRRGEVAQTAGQIMMRTAGLS